MESEVMLPEVAGNYLPVVECHGNHYVLVSHHEFNSLIGRLMQMCELTGDAEQRQALKLEIKLRVRDWLNNHYEDCGYNPREHVMRGDYKAVKI